MRVKLFLICIAVAASFCLMVEGLPPFGAMMFVSLGIDALALLMISYCCRRLFHAWDFAPYQDVDVERWEDFESKFRSFVTEGEDIAA